MTMPVTAPARTDRPARTLADQIATLLPARAGSPWTVEPYTPWWTARHPASRLVQGERALILVLNDTTWNTEIGWQLPGREPYEPDLTLHTLAPDRIAREVLRLALPVLDDEAAARQDTSRTRLELLYEIGTAVRAQGVATYERGGLLRNTSTVTWSSSGVRYSATLHGGNPACTVQIEGPLRAVERAVAHFLPEAVSGRPVVPSGIQGRLERRLARMLARHGHVEQLERRGLVFGSGPGPYGHVAPALDPAARAHDTLPASVDIQGVGVDFLVSLAPRLAR